MGKAIAFMGMLSVLFVSGFAPARAEGPQRIISLAPSLTREIYDLKEQGRLVGVTSFCPENARRNHEVVGSLTLLNFEKICALEPDLVLASMDSNKQADIEKLKALKIEVVVFEGCESFSCMCSEFMRLGAVIGREHEAAAIVSDIRRKVDALRARTAGHAPLRVFWQMGTNPMVTAGDDTYTGELIRLAGCRNIFGQLKAKYPRVNVENVVAGDPEVIFTVSGMDGPMDQPAPWSRFAMISAVRNNRVYALNADLVCQPTPGMFLAAFETMIGHLYPEAP
ncbi:MAG TPA: helical backbone metal receptor [Deltaproteobacteria bacterium]|nr:helical backbone metal receptor [Deltaproteobacteria bacterium]